MKLSITYGAIHQRVRNHWGKPSKCELCKGIKPRYEWSNKDHKYKFIKNQWWQLCTSCHRKFDINKFGRPEAWWDKYFTDADFRLSQELDAYRVQYQVAKKFIKDRNQLFRYLHDISITLSGQMYGNLLSTQQALKLIKQ